MPRLKFHDRTTLGDIQQAFGGPGKFTLRATDNGDLHASGRGAWTLDELLARLGSVPAQDRLERGSEKAIELIRRAIDQEFGQGTGGLAFTRAEEKKGRQAVSLADLRSAALEVAAELAQQRMGMSFVRLATEAFEACGIDRAALKDGLPNFVEAMSKTVLDLKRPPGRDVHAADFRRAAQGALLAMLLRRTADERSLVGLEARMAQYFEPGSRHAGVELGEVYRRLVMDVGIESGA
jgi:hypothetical protein